MADEQKGPIAQSNELWARLSPRRRFAVVAVLGVTVLAIGVMQCQKSNSSYQTAFANLASEDAGLMVDKLREWGVPYRLEGTNILVPPGQVHDVRAKMGAEKLPRGGGVGFEIFDKQGFGTTRFVEKVNYMRAREGSLSRSIAALGPVRTARVHIARGRRSVFKDAARPPSASIVLHLHGHRKLSRGQVGGIVQMVSSSVNGLAPDRVSIVDQDGNPLTAGDDSDAAHDNRSVEKTLENKISKLVERVVGAGRVSVAVTAQIDRSRQNRTEEHFDKDSAALRSESSNEERTGGAKPIGGVAGARGNLPGAAGAKGGAAGKGLIRSGKTRNFELNRVFTRTVGPKSKLTKLHVAVLVDYVPAKDEKSKPTPHSAAMMGRITKIVREAAGIDGKRGDSIEVHNIPFVVEPIPEAPELPAVVPPPVWKQPPVVMAAGGAALLVVFLIGWMFARGRRKSAPQFAARPMQLTLPVSVEEMERALLQAPSADTPAALAAGDVYARVMAAAQNDAPRAARVLQGWLHDTEERSG